MESATSAKEEVAMSNAESEREVCSREVKLLLAYYGSDAVIEVCRNHYFVHTDNPHSQLVNERRIALFDNHSFLGNGCLHCRKMREYGAIVIYDGKSQPFALLKSEHLETIKHELEGRARSVDGKEVGEERESLP